MSEEEIEDPTVQHIYIQVRGLTVESAKAIQQQFILWIDNIGEQQFWQDSGLDVDFDYNYENGEYAPDIIIKEYEPEDE